MIDLILIIFLLVSLAKPDILLSKKIKEKASEEQKEIITKNLRKSYAILIALLESMALIRYNEFIGIILSIIFIILAFTIAIPANKEIIKIKKELNL